MKQCSNCGWVVDDGVSVCPSCKKNIDESCKYVCNQCGFVFSGEGNFCSKCGMKCGDKPKIEPLRYKKNASSTKTATDKEKDLGEQGLTKAQTVVNEETLQKAKAVGLAGVEAAKEIGKQGIEKVQTVVNEENLQKVKEAGIKTINKAQSVGSEALNGAQAVTESALATAGTIKFGKKELTVVAGALICGIIAGFAYNYGTGTATGKAFDTKAMMAKYKTGTAIESVKIAIVNRNRTPLMDIPSVIRGKMLMDMPRGGRLEYIETVESLDKDSNKAVTNRELRMTKTQYRNVIIPKGTELTITGMENGEHLCSFVVNGKSYSARFSPFNVERAYTGSWLKVKAYGKEGYVQVNLASAPSFE